VVDEHYYRTVEAFLKARGQYDKYDRKGPKIFVGEWGAYETPFEPWNPRSRGEAPTPNLRAAIGDAAWMIEMERNADLIIMHCYAPLLVNVNPGAQAVASQPDRLRRAARVWLSQLPRDQALRHARRQRDPQGDGHRHRRAGVGDPRQPVADSLREAREPHRRSCRGPARCHRRRAPAQPRPR
jgi:hypothetical protein